MKYTNLLMLPLLALLMAGCVIDDIPGICPGHEVKPDPDPEPGPDPEPEPDPTHDDYTIWFRYTGDGTSDLLGEKLEKVNLYVFDETETAILSREVDKASLISNHGVSIELPAGEEKQYTAVCIGNALQHTATCTMNGKGPDEIFFSHPAYQTGEGVITTNDHNYYGTTALTPEADNTVVFHSAHINVYVEVLGYHGYLERNHIPDNGPLRLCMKNLSPRMFFDGRFCPSKVDYHPAATPADGKKDRYTSSFSILRLDEAHPATLQLCTADDAEVYTVDIPAFLAANPGVDLTKEEADLPLRIDLRGKDVAVSVTVPDWDIEDTETNPDWGPW